MSSADTHRRQRDANGAESPGDSDGSPGASSASSGQGAVGASATPRAKPLLVAVLAACVSVFVADAALSVLVALAPTPNSYDVPRNPDFRRGWADYTRPRARAEDARLVIVISNSQGFLRENSDGNLAYPALLEQDLRADAAGDVIVANWSIAGGQSPEMIVLAARAAQHRPDAVLLVTSAGNFAPVWAGQPLSYWLSDATGLAYDPEVRALLSRGFLERTSADDPLGWFSARTGIGRARQRFVEKRDEAWTWRETAPTRLGDVVERTLDQRGEGFTLGVGSPAKGRSGASEDPDLGERDRGTASLLGEFVDALHATSPETPVLVVSMPIARPELPGAAWDAAARFHETAARALAGRRGVRVLDAVEVVDPALFVRATHLQPAGHRRFADWLLPHVQRALADRAESG